MTYNMVFGVGGESYVSQANYVQISGSGISAFDTAVAVSALLDSTNNLRIYATDSNGVIWLLRQTGTTGDSSSFRFVWSQWHPLGSNSLFLANGPGTLATTELFSVSSDNTIYVLSQNATTQRWTADQVKRPSGVAEDLDSLRLYKTVVNLQDENQQPLANSQITITAEEPVTIWVEGVQYELDAGDSVPGFTNNMGKLRVSSVTNTLHTSQLTFSSSAVNDPLVIYPPGNVKAYLAGQQTPPNRPTFTSDGAALTNAVDSNGDPYAPFSSLATNSNVPAASQAIMQISSATPTSNNLQPPVLQAVSLPGEPSSLSSFWEDLWNDLINYAEDFFFALRNGMISVLSAAYDAVSSTVTLIVQVVGDAVQRTINFIVKTYHDIANALHSAFLWLKTAVEDVIDWLKSLFDWKAILYTQQVIQYYIGESYGWLQGQIAQGQALAANFFANQESTVQQGFQWLQQQLTGTVDQSAQSPSITSSVSFKGLSFPPGILTLGSDVNWLLEKVENFLFGGSGGPLNPVNSLVDPVNTFFQDAAPAWQSLSTAMHNLQNLMQDLKSPSDFKNKAISDLLGTFENIVLAILQFADALTQALLVFASEALQNIDAAFTHNVDIPLVSYLYQKFTGQELSA